MEIDGVVELLEFFRSRPRAAPERVIRRVVVLPPAAPKRQKIALQAIRVLRSQAAVEKRPFVVIHRPRVRCPSVNVPRQLQHVVPAAAFLHILPDFLPQLARPPHPVLVITRPASAVSTASRDFLPEVSGNTVEAPVASHFILPGRANHLWDI